MSGPKPTVPPRRRSAINVFPRKALAQVRKPIAKPTRVAEGKRRYQRHREQHEVRGIVAGETEGC